MFFSLASGMASMMSGIAGGINQSRQIRLATEERLRQMRLQRDQVVGQATAVAGATGVEMTSSTIQDHLSRLEAEWNRRIQDAESAGSVMEGNALMSGVGGGMSNFMSQLAPLYDYQAKFGDPFASPQKGAYMDVTVPLKQPDFEWLKPTGSP